MMARILLIFVLVGMVAGCSEEPSKTASVAPPRQSVAAKAQPKVEVAAEEAKAVDEFVYNPSGLRDPFEALLAVRKPIVQKAAPLTPLQEYDLGQFRLIGAIVGKGQPKAMVEAPGGKPFMLEKGVKIGKNNGVVVDINDTEVVIEERYYDFSGAVRTSISKIQFPPREGVN